MAIPIPIFTLGTVVAPEATPLHARMKAEGRLLEDANETALVPWETNIVSAGMTREQRSIGMHWLANRLFHPEFFGDRMIRFIDRFTPPLPPGTTTRHWRRRPPRAATSTGTSGW